MHFYFRRERIFDVYSLVAFLDMVTDNILPNAPRQPLGFERLEERITRPDWCAARLCFHGECVLLREATCVGPSDDGGECDDSLREPDDNVMTQAYLTPSVRAMMVTGPTSPTITSTTELLRRLVQLLRCTLRPRPPPVRFLLSLACQTCPLAPSAHGRPL